MTDSDYENVAHGPRIEIYAAIAKIFLSVESTYHAV